MVRYASPDDEFSFNYSHNIIDKIILRGKILQISMKKIDKHGGLYISDPPNEYELIMSPHIDLFDENKGDQLSVKLYRIVNDIQLHLITITVCELKGS